MKTIISQLQNLNLYYQKTNRTELDSSFKNADNCCNFEKDLRKNINSHINLQDKRIGIAVGSRYLKKLPDILKCLVMWLRKQGADPFLFPAMGSHGGGSSDGQLQLLHTLGINEEYIGAPIISKAEPVMFSSNGHYNIYADASAVNSDGIILVNRIKPHTSYSGPIQSGLSKMACIGLGKSTGAGYYHAQFITDGFNNVIPSVLNEVKKYLRIIAGVAIIEDCFNELVRCEVVSPDSWLEREPILLKEAVSYMHSIPLRKADLLIVDEIGKSISGSGMDTNIIGKKQDFFQFDVQRIYVRDINNASAGNAVGIGLADIVHARILEKFDPVSSYLNAETSFSPDSVKIPIHYPSDQENLTHLNRMIAIDPDKNPIIVWIRNTSDISFLLTNTEITGLQCIKKQIPINYSADGDLPDFLGLISSYIT